MDINKITFIETDTLNTDNLITIDEPITKNEERIALKVLKQFLQAEIERKTEALHTLPYPSSITEIISHGYRQAINDDITHLQTLIETIE
jgi:hypothetical protein